MVLRELAAAATHEHEREVLQQLLTAAEANVALLAAEAATADRLAPARHRLLATVARRSFVPVLIAFEAEQSRAAASASSGELASIPDETGHVASTIMLRAEVLRGLAATSRQRYSGNFRAAVFGANDGLVSNLALVVGMSATGVSAGVVLAAGVAGLLAGALSMAAGEYISVRSARELLQASRLKATTVQQLASTGLPDDQIALIYRARGMSGSDAGQRAQGLNGAVQPTTPAPEEDPSDAETNHVVGQAWGAAISSFFFFASGALIPIMPYVVGLGSSAAMLAAVALVGAALLATGATVGLLSGASATGRALRQLAIGYGAASVTYLLGLVFGAAGVG